MQQTLSLLWNGLLDLVYPPICLVCGSQQESPFCSACAASIRPVPPPYCERCGAPAEFRHPVCEECLQAAPPFAWSQTLGHYEGPLAKAVQRLKYNERTALASPLGRLLAHSLDVPPTPLLSPEPNEGESGFDLVIPIPLHPSRYRERGFNQAELLAEVVAKERGWQLETQNLRRIRATSPQARMDREGRIANVQGAFSVRVPLAYQGKRVLLVDDVLTTMSTVRAAAGVVREAGASRIGVIALARGG
jgi:ComF family protein